MKVILVFRLPNGREPFEDWVKELPDQIRARIEAYIVKVSFGGVKKNIKALKDGVFEIKIDFGPGWRVYFGEDGQKIILLIGGIKKTQTRDIEKAKEFWRYYAQE